MDVRNCSRCGKIYAYDGFKICLQCRREDEKDFKIIKEYIDENPGANISEVSEGTGVDTKKIIEFLREGRLEVEDEHNLLLSCERCGASIKTGRFCEKCNSEMQREFKRTIGGGRDSRSISNGRAREKIRITDRRRHR
ncbi:TIGR03826 family flagellar region protein [Clostridium sp. Cult2]|uniref:TIGR03826 family flagellar region protein n=1 Tax=Clostridium sp. Cult2 TaxID=2079003 RepID=UPI001F36B0D1|nr:TIGR03826 family flagellar region protein [Clostridium sp. Cult2]MCF6465076.1 MerR family transcriptional regulator [Clostridium sp. Cult2]